MSVTEIIASMKDLADELGDPLPASELWPRLYASLDKRGLDPRETLDDKRRPIEIMFNGGSVTYKSFNAMLSRARNKTLT